MLKKSGFAQVRPILSEVAHISMRRRRCILMFRAVPSDLFFKLPVLGTFRAPYGDQNGLKKFFWDFHVFQYGQLPHFHGRNFKNSETFFSRYDPYPCRYYDRNYASIDE